MMDVTCDLNETHLLVLMFVVFLFRQKCLGMDVVERIVTGDPSNPQGRSRIRQAVVEYWKRNWRLLRAIGAEKYPFAYSGILPKHAQIQQACVARFSALGNEEMVASAVASIASCVGERD